MFGVVGVGEEVHGGGGNALMVVVELMLMGCHQGSVLTCVGGVGGVGSGLACEILLGSWSRYVGRSWSELQVFGCGHFGELDARLGVHRIT